MNIKSDYFDIEEIHQGVFAIIDKEDGVAGCNAGIIDCGDLTIVFDTLLNVDAARDLKKKCLELTGREAGIAVNSHPHIDHFHGNAVFGGGTVILASKLCNELLLKQEKRYPFREMPGEEELMKLKERVDKGSGIQLLNDKNEYLFSRCLAVKDYHLRMPNIVFDKSLLIQGKTRTVRLESAGNCHSEDDVILCLDDEKILFAGDTLFVKQHPWLGSGNPVNQKKFLLGELNSPYEKYIPGHGGLGTKQDLKDQSEYIGIIIDYVKNTDPNKKLTLEDLPEKFKNWDPLCFQWNLDSIKETIEE